VRTLMTRSIGCLLVAAMPCLPSCTVGNTRDLDTKANLSGLDLTYLQSQSHAMSSENEQHVDGQVWGAPFWFFPGLLANLQFTQALHRGAVEPGDPDEPDEPLESKVSGYDRTEVFALGLGLLYEEQEAEWDAAGELRQWRKTEGLGFGLLYNAKEQGDSQGRKALTRQILGGLLGYTEENDRGYLELLWIPIPIRWQ